MSEGLVVDTGVGSMVIVATKPGAQTAGRPARGDSAGRRAGRRGAGALFQDRACRFFISPPIRLTRSGIADDGFGPTRPPARSGSAWYATVQA